MMSILTVKKAGKALEIRVATPKASLIEVRLESFRNRTISRITDQSACMPIHLRPLRTRTQEVWYPVVDIDPEEDIEAVASFDHTEGGQFVFNGMFDKTKYPLAPEIVFSADRLEHWENALATESPRPRLTNFWIRVRSEMAAGEWSRRFRLLSSMWSGVVSVYALEGTKARLLDSAVVPQDVEASREPAAGDDLRRALDGALTFLLNARNAKASSPTFGGVNLFYDFDAKLFRTSHWVWTWGIVIRLLLSAADAGIGGHDPALLRQAAVEMGERSLTFQRNEPGYPADGVVRVRQDIWPDKDFDYHGCYSHADSMFLAGWGWMPLYRLTGDKRYLEATRRLAGAIEKTNDMFPIIPQDYYETEAAWAPHGINESGFGAKGFAEAFLATGDSYYKAVADAYFRQHLDVYQLENGLWNRYYHYAQGKVEDCNYWTRGMGWGMMGLLAMNDIEPGGRYLDYAIKMASHLIAYQHESGCWAHQFTGSIAETGACEKSTSLWCMLFYQLHRVTGDARHLDAARKALHWCMEHQYFGPDPDAEGALIGFSANSGIVYRNWFNMACSYSSAFFGIALLEEWQLTL